ncbi:MAG: hypothetical protein EBZ36_10255 [Acidobacteria bacterium]|nr:hypothetical protein [Acidobacteriota bacterium]
MSLLSGVTLIFGSRRSTPGSTIRATERQFFAELVFLLKTFFFVYLGISLRFGGWASAGYAALIVALIYIARLVITRFTTPETTTWKDAAFTSIMVPKGLAAAVLAGMPLERGVPEGAIIQDTVYMVVLFSITVTAVLAPLIERGTLNGLYRPVFKGFAEGHSPTTPGTGNPQA